MKRFARLLIIGIAAIVLLGFTAVAAAQEYYQAPTTNQNTFPPQSIPFQPPYSQNNQQSTINNQPVLSNVEGSVVNNSYAPNLAPGTPQNMQTLIQGMTFEFLGTISCILTGVNPVHIKGQCLGYDATSGKLGYVDSSKSIGLVGLTGNLVAMTFQKPASSIEYLSYLSDNFGLTKKAHAQKTGYTLLGPLEPIWILFRNITYLLFVIVLIFIGIGIMLRLQIDPRTVMSVQNQIPKVIIALILITFSYAIAGFLIDVMWMGVYLVVNTFQAVGGKSVTDMLIDPFAPPFAALDATANTGEIDGSKQTFGIFNIVFRSATAVGFVFNRMIVSYIENAAPGYIVGAIIGGLVAGPVGGALGGGVCGILEITNASWCKAVLHNPIGATGGLFAGMIAWIVIFIAVWWALLRLWFALIKAYVFILISILLSPFWILGGLLPGSPGGFGAWMRDLIGNLAAFPAVFALFALARIFMDKIGTSSNFFVPPLVGGSYGADHIATLIGLGCILLSPEAVRMVREAVKAPEFKYAAAVGRAMGIGGGAVTGFGRTAGGVRHAAEEYRISAVDEATGKISYGQTGPWRALSRHIFR